MKNILFKQRSDKPHWVGDGFPVRTMFSYQQMGEAFSPFLMMDYAGPAEFTPTKKPRGVGEHPHRGFETVTIVYSGGVVHRDSAGGGGKIGPGDVQWMTAASGLVHDEMHSEEFSKSGGVFEMVQLWVNLPAKEKMTSPRYQGIIANQIPQVETAAGTVRIIAGEFNGNKGPAKTFTPVELYDVRLKKNGSQNFKIEKTHNTLVFVLDGEVQLNGGNVLKSAEIAALDHSGDNFTLTGRADSKLLILAGAAINEPIVGHGPFVMNTTAEIHQAMEDYNKGRMGKL